MRSVGRIKKPTVPGFPRLFAGICVGSLIAIACHGQEAEPESKSKWERSAAAGLTLTQGNRDTVLFTTDIKGIRKWDEHELSLGASGTYGEVEDEKSTESIRGFVQYNRLFSERMYGYARLDALHDAISDVDYRITLGPGLGYYFIKNDRTRLSGEVGPSFVLEKQGGDSTSYMAVRFAEQFEHKINDRARIWQSAELLPQVDDFGNFVINAEIGIEASLTEKLSLRSFIQDTYDNEPARGRKKNDVKLVTALAYKF